MQKNTKTRKITLIALITALTVALSLNFIIPIPQTKGFVTLCEAGIYLAALLLGGPAGLAVGALSGGLIDLISGYPQWLFFSVVIHGLQGLVAGKIAFDRGNKLMIAGLTTASVLMVIGYGLAGWLLNGFGYGLASIPGNTLQNIFGIVIALPVYKALSRTNLVRPIAKY
ncbi:MULTISPECIES: ECF transporter S component [unclassified Enterococcus]|uniref:ECF transporter S component n=1 Tax=unclassified Enterococcus TaxID=2608891 RepID=UPI00155650C7|nr:MULTISPECIES: ECF transporter S component [unclassified Enterococcus]MBS7576996.1 ECF transporter S component [Enterococcus sp. MMGLQ5-2]MBS7584557.1 ECF transporter S component [Enterococcus sp. MMGLQ5-1]NPD12412.1 ECF transporter S component [Enterococcus sp. MMGLQ5-1]NPD36830.1 ECF transporter S component [Enterococcus sp. MMGLQ5-2]